MLIPEGDHQEGSDSSGIALDRNEWVMLICHESSMERGSLLEIKNKIKQLNSVAQHAYSFV